MNNAARIKELQSSEKNKRLVAAFRQTYSDAKCIDLVNACICLLVPVAITVVQMFESLPHNILILVWLTTMVMGFFLPKKTEVLCDEAARMQQRFDSTVFGIKFENTIHDDIKIASRANRYLEHHKYERGQMGLDGWYSAEIGGMKAGEAIARCQHQNIEWTRRLLRRSICCEIGIAALIGIALHALSVLTDVDPCNLFFFFSILEWSAQRAIRAGAALWKLRGLVDNSASFDLTSKQNIVNMQEKIFAYRSASYLVPDWLYELFKRRDNSATAI